MHRRFLNPKWPVDNYQLKTEEGQELSKKVKAKEKCKPRKQTTNLLSIFYKKKPTKVSILEYLCSHTKTRMIALALFYFFKGFRVDLDILPRGHVFSFFPYCVVLFYFRKMTSKKFAILIFLLFAILNYYHGNTMEKDHHFQLIYNTLTLR